MAGQARAVPPVPRPASASLAPFEMTVAQREERLLPPKPIPHVARTVTEPAAKSSPLVPRPRSSDAAPRKRLRLRSSGQSWRRLTGRTAGCKCSSPQASRDHRHNRLIVRDRVLAPLPRNACVSSIRQRSPASVPSGELQAGCVARIVAHALATMEIHCFTPQICWEKHALFTSENWGKRECSSNKTLYLLGVSWCCRTGLNCGPLPYQKHDRL